MAETVKRPSTGSSGSAAPRASDVERFKALSPREVEYEDTMGEVGVAEVWAKIYRDGLGVSPGEDQRAMLRYASYVYGCKNGTSRAGNYVHSYVLADGTKVASANIAKATGERRIRQFYRGNMDESYDYLKGSEVIANDPRMVAKAAELGYPPECAFAMADWLTGCPKFTPLERRCHDDAKAYSLDKSKRARGGKHLEVIEKENRQHGLAVQGPAFVSEETVEF